MFRLQLATDPRWVRLAEKNLEEILSDHAWCEQKAASNAISLIVCFPECSEMIAELIDVAQEELEHFNQVHQKLLERGYSLGRERKDEYVNLLYGFQLKGGSRQSQLLDRLLFAAMIEARSCERFRLLAEQLSDDDLKAFYSGLMESEASHYTLFITWARHYVGAEQTEKRWKEWLDFEGEVIRDFGVHSSIHG